MAYLRTKRLGKEKDKIGVKKDGGSWRFLCLLWSKDKEVYWVLGGIWFKISKEGCCWLLSQWINERTWIEKREEEKWCLGDWWEIV